jgi:hypothetical protein
MLHNPMIPMTAALLVLTFVIAVLTLIMVLRM